MSQREESLIGKYGLTLESRFVIMNQPHKAVYRRKKSVRESADAPDL